MKIIATKKNQFGFSFIVEKYSKYYYANMDYSNSEVDIIDYRVILSTQNVKYCIKNKGFKFTTIGETELK